MPSWLTAHLLLRRKLALQPDEALVGGEPGVKLARVGLGQHGRQLRRGSALGVVHLLRHRRRARAYRAWWRAARRCGRRCRRAQHSSGLAGARCAARRSPLLKPATSTSRPAITAKARQEQRAGDEQPRVAEFERLLAPGLRARRWRRRAGAEMARPAGIVVAARVASPVVVIDGAALASIGAARRLPGRNGICVDAADLRRADRRQVKVGAW